MDHSLSALTVVAVVSGCVIAWGLLSARLERLDVSAPIAFVLLGLGATHGPLALIHLHLRSAAIRSLAEVTLALVLFADATRVNARALRADSALPARLLGIGLPLTIGAGIAAATLLFHGNGIWVAAAIGAIVAPTDAALGAWVMQDQLVPARVRRLLNVESGLNDGIVTPFVNLFLAGAVATETVHASGVGSAAIQLVGGAGLGVGIGVAGAVLVSLADRTKWSDPGFRPLAVLALALFAYSTALAVHANGFIAAFVAGLAFGTATIDEGTLLTFSEQTGTLLSLLVWFIFGAVMLVPGFEAATWRDVLFAVLALTVVRMVPVAVALTGSGLDRATVLFVGWFGPRGLASVVFALVAADSLVPEEANVLLAAVTVTVALSVIAHGVSASPLAQRYGLRVADLHPTRPEHGGVSPLQTRSLSGVRRGRS